MHVNEIIIMTKHFFPSLLTHFNYCLYSNAYMAQKSAISLLNLSIIIQSVKILPWGKFVQEGGLKEVGRRGCMHWIIWGVLYSKKSLFLRVEQTTSTRV